MILKSDCKRNAMMHEMWCLASPSTLFEPYFGKEMSFLYTIRYKQILFYTNTKAEECLALNPWLKGLLLIRNSWETKECLALNSMVKGLLQLRNSWEAKVASQVPLKLN